MLDFILFSLFIITCIRLLNLLVLFKGTSTFDKEEFYKKIKELSNPLNRFILNVIILIQSTSLITHPIIYGVTFWISYNSFFKVLKILLSNV